MTEKEKAVIALAAKNMRQLAESRKKAFDQGDVVGEALGAFFTVQIQKQREIIRAAGAVPQEIGHVYVTPETCECRNHESEFPRICNVCDGGLSICSVCRLLEGALTSECPGERAFDKSDDIYAGRLDFVNGEWVEGAKNPTNEGWALAAKLDEARKAGRS